MFLRTQFPPEGGSLWGLGNARTGMEAEQQQRPDARGGLNTPPATFIPLPRALDFEPQVLSPGRSLLPCHLFWVT